MTNPDRKERHRLRRAVVGLICRRRGHDFTTRQVSPDHGYEFCRRCKLGENR